MDERKKSKPLLLTIVVLLRNTTWRCGKLERSVVRSLYKTHQRFGKPEMSVNALMLNINLADEKQNELIDAIKRLEKRNIVKTLAQ